ncbi:response regulator transcription factor [Wenyingzhuangia sp. IMCC45467]
MQKIIELFKEVFDTHEEYLGTVVEHHIQKLRELDEYLPPTQSFFIVTNTSKQTYEFVSKNFEVALGLDRNRMTTEGLPYWFSHFHPEDIPIWLGALEDLMIFTMTQVAEEDRKKLCYTWNFRVRNSKNEYVNLFEHQTPTYFDEQGKPIIGISHQTIVGAGEKKPIIGVIKKLNDQNEYETIYYKNYSQKLLSASLSNREQDVIRLLALNKTSREIGEKLFISQHTVDGHRRNILKKLNFSSTQDLVYYCLKNQLF